MNTTITENRWFAIPIKVFYSLIDISINFLRSLGVYKTIYDTSLLLISGFNRRKYLSFYSRFIKKGDLCFDIGANKGVFTDIFLRLGAKVVAVEPQESCMKGLKRKYSGNNKVFLLKKAIGDKKGRQKLMVSDSHTLSSMSKEWTDSIKSSEMFFVSTDAFKWQKTNVVQVTTLDRLIDEFGIPDFLKVDVEGYEYKVLKKLKYPVKTISFEFTPTKKFIEKAIKVVKHLASLGRVRFNYCIGESTNLEIDRWINHEEMIDILANLPKKNSISGDIYARF